MCIVSRNPDKAKEHKDIQEYVSKGRVVFLSKDLTQVGLLHILLRPRGINLLPLPACLFFPAL